MDSTGVKFVDTAPILGGIEVDNSVAKGTVCSGLKCCAPTLVAEYYVASDFVDVSA